MDFMAVFMCDRQVKRSDGELLLYTFNFQFICLLWSKFVWLEVPELSFGSPDKIYIEFASTHKQTNK